MADEVIVIVDLGHENCSMIKEDVESFGVTGIICAHDVEEEVLQGFGNIRGFILNGGPAKTINGFRVDASEVIYESGLPTYSVDHASFAGVDLFTWPKDQGERRERIGKFLSDGCGLELGKSV